MEAKLMGFDAQGRATSKEFDTVATTIAQATTDVSALVTLFRAISDIGTSKYNLLSPVVAANAVGSPAANKDEAVIISLLLANGTTYPYRVPAPAKDADGVFEYVTGGIVDTANTDLVAFFDEFMTGGTMTINGVLVTAIIGGYLER